MLGAGTAASEAFSMQSSRANADDNAFVMAARRNSDVLMQLINYTAAEAVLGEAPMDANAILGFRATGGQPQSGGGPGQPVSFPVQQQLPGAPAVYSVNPTTGVITKA